MANKQVCRCGKGIMSLYDNLCGHCRTNKQKMKFEDAITKMRELLNSFERDWIENNQKQPEYWPMEFETLSDWYEQFHSYSESEEQK